MDISVITIITNGYGAFIRRWLDSIKLQTVKPKEIIIVQGQNHGLTEVEDGVRLIRHEQEASMGLLRNLALKEAKGEYILYLSADDILLSNAIEEISKVEADIIALKYYLDGRIYASPEVKTELVGAWRDHYTKASGYVAFKRGLEYDDTDFPNYPLMFQAKAKGYKYGQTEKPCAIYIKRTGSMSGLGREEEGLKEIKKYVRRYFPTAVLKPSEEEEAKLTE